MKPEPISIRLGPFYYLGLYFKDPLSIVGFVILGISGLLHLAFTSDGDWQSIRFTLSKVSIAEGIVHSSVQEPYFIGEDYVMITTYNYKVGEDSYFGDSYSLGYHFDNGEAVEVEYLTNNPQFSRILGTGNAPREPNVFFIFIVPIIGLLILRSSVKRMLKISKMMRKGNLIMGQKVEEKRGSSPDLTVLIYQYPIGDRNFDYQIETRIAEDYLEEEPIIYMDNPPTISRMVRDMPERVVEKMEEAIGRPLWPDVV